MACNAQQHKCCPSHNSKLLCGVQPVPRSELSLCDATRRVASSPATDGSNAKKARSRSVVSITATSGSAVKPVSACCTKSQGWNQFARVPLLCIVLFLQALDIEQLQQLVASRLSPSPYDPHLAACHRHSPLSFRLAFACAVNVGAAPAGTAAARGGCTRHL